MATLKDLEPEIQQFEQLDSDSRKDAVRALEPRVRTGEITLSDSELEHALSSRNELSRILAYLALHYGRVPTNPASLRAMLTTEMESLRRQAFDEQYPRMPLYYATRAYLERVKTDRSLATAAAADIPMLRRIESELLIRDVDREGQVLPKIQEAIEHLRSARDEGANATIASARLALIGVIVAALIAAASSIVSAVISVRGQAEDRTAEKREAAVSSSPSTPPATATKPGAPPPPPSR